METTCMLLSLAAIIFLLLLLKRSRRDPNPKLPPGPWQLPIIGSIHHLLGSESLHHRFRRLSHTHGPLMHFRLGEVSMVVASSPEAAREIMKTHDAAFASRPSFSVVDNLSCLAKCVTFSPYGEHWRDMRKICVLKLLSSKQIKALQHIREQETYELIQSISSISRDVTSAVNLTKLLFQLTNNIMMRAIMGTKRREFREKFLEELGKLISLLDKPDPSDFFPSLGWMLSWASRTKVKAQKCMEEIDRLLESIIEEHREGQINGTSGDQEAGALVDVLLGLQEDGDFQCILTDLNIRAIMMDLFSGGSETSATVVLWAMSELIRNPRVMKKVQTEVRNAFKGNDKMIGDCVQELNYLQLIIKETMRMHPPGPMLMPRECREKTKILGYEIPEKAIVCVNAWAIGMDPSCWEDPEKFNPERFEGSDINFIGTNFELLPFGAGRRMCPGSPFALAMIEFALAHLLNNFDWELPTNSEIQEKSLDMSEVPGLAAKRKFDLILHAVPRIPYD